MSKIKFSLLLILMSFCSVATSQDRFTCNFEKSILVDNSGVYEGAKWISKGFTIQDDWVVLDKGNLKLKLTTNIQKPGVLILRGGELNKGYQFSLENGDFIYVLLIVPTVQTWTVTGKCKKEIT